MWHVFLYSINTDKNEKKTPQVHMGPVSIGVEVQQNNDGDTPSILSVKIDINIVFDCFCSCLSD